jgi:hypothetical protein
LPALGVDDVIASQNSATPIFLIVFRIGARWGFLNMLTFQGAGVSRRLFFVESMADAGIFATAMA